MQETIYQRLLAVEARMITEEAPRMVTEIKGESRRDVLVKETVQRKDLNEVWVRVFKNELNFMVRLDSSGQGEGVGPIAFTRHMEEAIEFAVKVTLDEARHLFKTHRMLEAFVTQVASAPVERPDIPIPGTGGKDDSPKVEA